MKSIRSVAVVAMLAGFFSNSQVTHAAFHLVQIEQVIGGVNGDTNAQAIQLRFKVAGQNAALSGTRIRAWDAAGLNPIIVGDIAGPSLPNGAAGARVLLTTTAFNSLANVPVVSNYTMINPIPASYLNAGRLTFEQDAGATFWWILGWGGASYTGPMTGVAGSGISANDADGNFGPAFGSPLPSTTLQALQFTGAANADSTNNAAQYAITAGASAWINNAGTSFTLVDPPDPDPNSGDFDGDDDVDGEDFLTWQRNTGGAGTFVQGDANHNGTIDGDDLAIWEGQYNTDPPGPLANVAAIPEPNAAVLLFAGLMALNRRRVRHAAQCP